MSLPGAADGCPLLLLLLFILLPPSERVDLCAPRPWFASPSGRVIKVVLQVQTLMTAIDAARRRLLPRTSRSVLPLRHHVRRAARSILRQLRTMNFAQLSRHLISPHLHA